MIEPKKPKKLIVCGNVIEIYEYEKPPKAPEGNFDSKDDYNPFDFENTKIEPREVDRVEERRRQSLRDSRNLTKRLALMNFNNGDKFLTLTFDPSRFDDHSKIRNLDFVDKEFKKFIQRFNYKFKTKLKYLAVRETHKSGVFHFHMICNWEKDFSCEEEIRASERFLGKEVWKHGFVDIKTINHVDNVGAYIIKYMTKDLSIELFKGKKMYLCSKGLKRPFVYKDHEADLIIQQYGLDLKKEVFTNSYESEYLGKIVYSEFNLLR